MGELFSQLERRLHVALRAIDRDLPGAAESRNALKVAFCAEHGITARHYNSLLRALDGKHVSVIEKAKIDITDLEDRLKSVRKKITESVKKLDKDAAARARIAARAAAGKAPTRGQARDRLNDKDRAALRRGVHGRRRQASRLEGRIVRLRVLTELQVPPIVFGSRKLLRSRPKDGTPEGRESWLRRWRDARSAQIFSVGSKDEPGGSQCCRPLWDGWETGTIGLRLRRIGPVPAGASPHIEITGIPLNKHAAALLGPVRALFAAKGSTAVSVRLVRTLADELVPEGSSRWEALITVEEAVPDAPSRAGGRVLGVDVNADHLAWALLSADGNRLKTGRIRLPLDEKSAEARRSLICEAASALVKVAATEGGRDRAGGARLLVQEAGAVAPAGEREPAPPAARTPLRGAPGGDHAPGRPSRRRRGPGEPRLHLRHRPGQLRDPARNKHAPGRRPRHRATGAGALGASTLSPRKTRGPRPFARRGAAAKTRLEPVGCGLAGGVAA